jgi:NAD(P)-dependent dehydrogenase (short-subunit alcohol dehydrogenase family)
MSRGRSLVWELAGRAAIVAGARNNLGRGFAVALAEKGADVLVHHHTPDTRDQAEETARMCWEHGVRTAIFTGDLAPSANVRAMYDAAFSSFGRVDVVVNNAGRIKKAPVEEFTRMLAREIGHRRVTVNVIAPGPVDTPFFHSQETPQTVAYLASSTPARRPGLVSDIVPVVAFLASPRAHWISGQTIWVNDGYGTR